VSGKCVILAETKHHKFPLPMSRVLFRVSYNIPDGKRNEYMQLINKLKNHYSSMDVEYSVFEDKGKHNHFQEVYVYPSMDAYEASDDPSSLTEVSEVIDAVYNMAANVVYDVAKEIA